MQPCGTVLSGSSPRQVGRSVRSQSCIATDAPTVLRAGRANATRPGAPRLGDHMRIASVSKAFSGAVALHLVQEDRLGLDDTIGQLLAGVMPAEWSAVTVGEMLNHTSGLPDYTSSDGFREQVTKAPRGFVSPMQIIDWVRKDHLRFTPGSQYEYSNTDNIVVAMVAERVTGMSYAQLLSSLVFGPARLTQTTFPTRRLSLPAPFIHGYDVQPGKRPRDVTTFLSPSGAWASGAIVSTPADLGTFMARVSRRPVFRNGTTPLATAFRPGFVQPARPWCQLGGSGDISLQDALRHGLRPYRQLPRIRAVGCRHGGRTALGHDLLEYRGADGRSPDRLPVGSGVRSLRLAREVSSRHSVLARL